MILCRSDDSQSFFAFGPTKTCRQNLNGFVHRESFLSVQTPNSKKKTCKGSSELIHNKANVLLNNMCHLSCDSHQLCNRGRWQLRRAYFLRRCVSQDFHSDTECRSGDHIPGGMPSRLRLLANGSADRRNDLLTDPVPWGGTCQVPRERRGGEILLQSVAGSRRLVAGLIRGWTGGQECPPSALTACCHTAPQPRTGSLAPSPGTGGTSAGSLIGPFSKSSAAGVQAKL